MGTHKCVCESVKQWWAVQNVACLLMAVLLGVTISRAAQAPHTSVGTMAVRTHLGDDLERGPGGGRCGEEGEALVRAGQLTHLQVGEGGEGEGGEARPFPEQSEVRQSIHAAHAALTGQIFVPLETGKHSNSVHTFTPSVKTHFHTWEASYPGRKRSRLCSSLSLTSGGNLGTGGREKRGGAHGKASMRCKEDSLSVLYA